AESIYYSGSDYRSAASQMFRGLFRPYFLATNEAERLSVLQRVTFSCDEDLQDPSQSGRTLSFPFDLMPDLPGTLVWHRMLCTFSLHYSDLTGAVSYTSPAYRVNQLDVDYGTYGAEPGVAFENYDFGDDQHPDYRWLGRYVQPLDKMLRRKDDSIPSEI